MPSRRSAVPGGGEMSMGNGLRETVQQFAWLMENGLRANEYLPGWQGADVWDLQERLVHRVADLSLALHAELAGRAAGEPRCCVVGAAAAEVGNLAMLIAEMMGEVGVDRGDRDESGIPGASHLGRCNAPGR